MLMYKEGEPLQELVSYYQKEGGSQLVEVSVAGTCLPGVRLVDPALTSRILNSLLCFAHPRLQVRIPSHCLTSNNRQVRARQLWGSDTYTSDSDLVAVLMHCGYIHHSSTFLTHFAVFGVDGRTIFRPPM